MLQDESSIGWDPIYLPPHISPVLRIYTLFVLIAVIVTMARLIGFWIAAPPFRLSRVTNNPDYVRRLRIAHMSVKQWMICTLLAGGFVAAMDLYQISRRLLEAQPRNPIVALLAIRDFLVIPEMALLAAFFLFLAQWHLLNRTERLAN
jgi:hypothetical protein